MHEGSCPEITQERTGVGFAVSKKGKQPMTGRFPKGGLNEKGPCLLQSGRSVSAAAAAGVIANNAALIRAELTSTGIGADRSARR